VVELNWKHDPRAAEESFKQALALARDRKARGWELKAAESLADLLRSENRPEASRELEQLINWFGRFDKPANQ
jgi:thioredoxin-like negative regulator of GroEL